MTAAGPGTGGAPRPSTPAPRGWWIAAALSVAGLGGAANLVVVLRALDGFGSWWWVATAALVTSPVVIVVVRSAPQGAPGLPIPAGPTGVLRVRRCGTAGALSPVVVRVDGAAVAQVWRWQRTDLTVAPGQRLVTAHLGARSSAPLVVDVGGAPVEVEVDVERDGRQSGAVGYWLPPTPEQLRQSFRVASWLGAVLALLRVPALVSGTSSVTSAVVDWFAAGSYAALTLAGLIGAARDRRWLRGPRRRPRVDRTQRWLHAATVVLIVVPGLVISVDWLSRASGLDVAEASAIVVGVLAVIVAAARVVAVTVLRPARLLVRTRAPGVPVRPRQNVP